MPRSYAYHPNFGRVIPFAIDTLPDDPDQQVAFTVRKLIRNAQADKDSPYVQRAAQRAAYLGQNPRLSPARQAINGVWAYIKGHMRFMEDEQQARMLQSNDPRLGDVIEVVIRPVDMARLIEETGRGYEDCDGFTGYAASLLAALGITVKMCVASANEDEPDNYSHIYIVAYADGERIPLDFSHGPAIGWECPNTGRLREWSISSACQLSDLLVPAFMLLGIWWAYPHFRKAAVA